MLRAFNSPAATSFAAALAAIMSIYSTLWALKFPSRGDFHTGCAWLTVLAQGVPEHIGSEETAQYEFLPPHLRSDVALRAVVFVTGSATKGTLRSPQEYADSLLVMSGIEYQSTSFPALHEKLCDSLRGKHPRLSGESLLPNGQVRLIFEDGTSSHVSPSGYRALPE